MKTWDVVAPSTWPRLEITAAAHGLLTLLIVTSSALFSLALQSNWQVVGALGISGLFVDDAQSLQLTTRIFWADPLAPWPPDQLAPLIGVVLLYWPLGVTGSAYSVIAINILLLWASSELFVRSVDGGSVANSRTLSILVTIVVSTNIYVSEVMGFPNKEIPLIFLTNLFVYLILRRSSFVPAFFVATVIYLFRDGYGIIAMMIAALLFFKGVFGSRFANLLLVALVVVLAFAPSDTLTVVDPAVARNARIGEALVGEKFTSFGTTGSYLVKLAGNIFNLGLRPQISDASSSLFLVGVGYWQFGMLLIAGLAGELLRTVRKARLGGNAFVLFASVAAISYGAFVQPRYMMPMIYLLGFGAFQLGSALWLVPLGCVASAFLFYLFGGLPLPA